MTEKEYLREEATRIYRKMIDDLCSVQPMFGTSFSGPSFINVLKEKYTTEESPCNSTSNDLG